MDQILFRDILLWKKEYGNVYAIRINVNWYYYRSLSKGEFAALLTMSEKCGIADTEEAILSECLLYPKYSEEKFKDSLAGEIDSLYQSIINTIGFSATDRFLDDVEKARASLGSLENQIILLVCKAFPHLTLSDIDNLTYEELLRYLTVSEAILDVKVNIEKPSSNKPGSIDFDQENKVMEKPVPFDRPKRSKRGDVSK
jgi:hypothetical protein